MNFIDRIIVGQTETDEETLAGVAKIVNSNGLPTLLYGAGLYASELLQNIKNYGIHIVGVAVDDEYFKEGAEFHGHKIRRISEFQSEKYNILLGFCYVTRNKLREIEKIHNVFVIDNFVVTENFTADDNLDGFLFAYNSMQDDFSRDTMVAFLNQKIAKSGKSYLKTVFCDDEYFPEDIIRLSDDEVFVDCGAFTGDTVENFIKRGGGNYITQSTHLSRISKTLQNC